MVKIFVASALLVLAAYVGTKALMVHPKQRHPGVPLSVVPRKKFHPIVRAKFHTKIITPALGAKTSGCNRIGPTGGNCDALRYYGPDWSGYANGAVHRGI